MAFIAFDVTIAGLGAPSDSLLLVPFDAEVRAAVRRLSAGQWPPGLWSRCARCQAAQAPIGMRTSRIGPGTARDRRRSTLGAPPPCHTRCKFLDEPSRLRLPAPALLPSVAPALQMGKAIVDIERYPADLHVLHARENAPSRVASLHAWAARRTGLPFCAGAVRVGGPGLVRVDQLVHTLAAYTFGAEGARVPLYAAEEVRLGCGGREGQRAGCRAAHRPVGAAAACPAHAPCSKPSPAVPGPPVCRAAMRTWCSSPGRRAGMLMCSCLRRRRRWSSSRCGRAPLGAAGAAEPPAGGACARHRHSCMAARSGTARHLR